MNIDVAAKATSNNKRALPDVNSSKGEECKKNFLKGELDMKKNKALRLASVLMMACLLTTCVISGTFAKYVTSDDGSDTARVAKWGVTITTTGQFVETYATDNNDVKGTITNSVVSVAAEDNSVKDAVLAPGTKGSMLSVALDGDPEVAVAVTYDAELTLANWEVDDTYYCPIVIKVGDVSFEGTSYSSATAFEDAVEAAIEACKVNLNPKTDLSTVATPVVTWSWTFSTSDANDEKDTKLGDAGTKASMQLWVKTTLTQID